jgi:hypothetical protein
MQELNIKVKIKDDKILSIVESKGIPEGVEGRLQIIGILEDLKAVELQKITTTISVNNRGGGYIDERYKKALKRSPKVFDIVTETIDTKPKLKKRKSKKKTTIHKKGVEDAREILDSVDENFFDDEDD